MTALKSNQVDGFLAKPNPAQPVVLIYGADSGLVRERAEALIRSAVDDVNDPFSLARLEGDELASDPSRLVEEANTIPLFGGRRAVWVKGGGRNFAPAVETLLANAPRECRVVIEAGELRKNAPLRVACERARNAAVIPCYPDDEKMLPALIEDEMRAAGLTIAPEARAALVPLLGGDRLASRSELRKLALYAHGKERVELADVAAVVTDASELALDCAGRRHLRRPARRRRHPFHQGAQRRHLAGRDPVRAVAPCHGAAQGAARDRRGDKRQGRGRGDVAAFQPHRRCRKPRSRPGLRRGSSAPSARSGRPRATPGSMPTSPRRSRSGSCWRWR